MHPAILALAKNVGVRIADRACDNSYIFDGESIATHFFPHRWIRNGKITKWGTPDEDFVRSGEPACYFLDHDILHEVMHFVAAAPEQRDLPEFGLGYTGGFCQAPVSAVVDHIEAEIQEKVTQFLCCHYGSKYGVSLSLHGEPNFDVNSWTGYMAFKWDGSPLHQEARLRCNNLINTLKL